MRKLTASLFVLLPLLALLLIAPNAFATVNHGDFFGASVDFLQVSETTLTADPEPLWQAPSIGGLGDQLVFTPTAFTSACSLGLAKTSDLTASTLTTTISAQPGGHIDNVTLVETGDTILGSFPPLAGTAATNGTAALSGTVTVLETTSGPITPVVIPFTGTFTPFATFALPVHLGANNWSGSISVDVSGVVPLATVAQLDLTNTLATNCGPGNRSATVQKKGVSGPSVAILVNPVPCELELDKTCCITQPVLPDLGPCEGDLISMTLEFTGDDCQRSSCDQGGSFECLGHRPISDPATVTTYEWHGNNVTAYPGSGIQIGDEVMFTGFTGKLPKKTSFKVSDPFYRKQYLKIDTSCQRAFECGNQFGAFKVAGFESSLGGVVDCDAPPPPPECATSGDPAGIPCDAKLVDMVLEYVGQDCQEPLPNPQNGEAQCAGDATGAVNVGITYTGKFGYAHQVSPASNINDGDRIRVTSTMKGGLFPNQKFLLTDSSGVVQSIEFHVSCSQPLFLGDQFGSFRLVEWTTKEGTHLSLGDEIPPADSCEVPLAPPGPHCTSDLQRLTLVYIGDYLGAGCTVSNSQGGYGTCSGVANPGDPVWVTVPSGMTADPSTDIEFGDLVSLSKTAGGDLNWLTALTVSGAGGSQNLAIKTSCQKPLSLGDRFGSFVVFGMDREEDGPIALGGNVQYQYTVTNPNTSTVDNVAINDDQLGEIASGVSLAPSASQTFVVPATLYGTTTNVATATGDVGGDFCAPAVDQVTVGVLAPPQGSFNCSTPISELKLIWNGAYTVDVKVWDGPVNSSTLHGYYDNVAPGDAITVTGLATNMTNPTYEIFLSAGFPKIGQSVFDLWCTDKNMNGIEDCGKNEGNQAHDNQSLNNDWLLEGMVSGTETLDCTPGLVAAPPDCGFGPELVLILPGLMWIHRRRLRKA